MIRHKVRTGTPSRRTLALAVVAAAAVVAAGCSSSSSGPSASSQVPASAKQTIVFATQGLGGEGTATLAAVKAFEQANPNITVSVLSLSSLSDVALQQLEQRFVSGSSTPDVITADVTYPATFARAGWIQNLAKFHPVASDFFAGQYASGTYKGQQYAIPWFINAEGLFYRTDLIKTPPTTIPQLVADAKAALAKDKSLKEGLAFEGDKYEGAVTVFQDFGANLAPTSLTNIDNPANVAALQAMSDMIHTYKIAPQAVSTWNEGNVLAAWQAGQAPFTTNWPFVFGLSEAKGSSLAGKTGWFPVPNASGGTPQASLGGDDLAINAKSTHQAAAWKLIQFLSSVSAQDARAVSAGDPPSVKAAYTSALLSQAPYYKQEQAVFQYATPRPVTPVWPQISAQLQAMISSVLSGQATAAAALKATAPVVAQLQQTAG